MDWVIGRVKNKVRISEPKSEPILTLNWLVCGFKLEAQQIDMEAQCGVIEEAQRDVVFLRGSNTLSLGLGLGQSGVGFFEVGCGSYHTTELLPQHAKDVVEEPFSLGLGVVGQILVDGDAGGSAVGASSLAIVVAVCDSHDAVDLDLGPVWASQVREES